MADGFDLKADEHRRERVNTTFVEMLIEVFFRHAPCWRAGKYLGSMIYLDFGEALIKPTLLGKAVNIGTVTMGVRDCYWRIAIADAQLLDSDQITDEHALLLNALFAGHNLLGVKRSKKSREIGFVFSDDLVLWVDATNKYEAEEDEAVVELKLGIGLLIQLAADGRFFMQREPPDVTEGAQRSTAAILRESA